MNDPMSQMAADVFAEMSRDPPGRIPHPQPEGDSPYPHLNVEREFFGDPPESTAPVSRRPEQWAREHTGQTLLVTTVAVGWLARLLRRGRRRRRSG